MTRLSSIFGATLLAFAISAGVSGCSSLSSSEAEVWSPSSIEDALAIAKENGLKWETKVLGDGVITSGEFEDTFDRYMSCAGQLGYVFEPKYLDPVDGQLWRSIGTYEGVGPEPVEKEQICEKRLGLIEGPYVMTTPKHMDPKLLSAFTSCLESKGIEAKGTEKNFNDFAGDDRSHYFEGPYVDCLAESMANVFPDVIGYGVGQ
ncbi:MAG: hypothetical protein IT191_05120 [Microbacteriaceae bacterium]|nr:hypothetical protein [Microbacteriaceae bacterium]